MGGSRPGTHWSVVLRRASPVPGHPSPVPRRPPIIMCHEQAQRERPSSGHIAAPRPLRAGWVAQWSNGPMVAPPPGCGVPPSAAEEQRGRRPRRPEWRALPLRKRHVQQGHARIVGLVAAERGEGEARGGGTGGRRLRVGTTWKVSALEAASSSSQAPRSEVHGAVAAPGCGPQPTSGDGASGGRTGGELCSRQGGHFWGRLRRELGKEGADKVAPACRECENARLDVSRTTTLPPLEESQAACPVAPLESGGQPRATAEA